MNGATDTTLTTEVAPVVPDAADLLRLGSPVLNAVDQLALLRQELRRMGYAGDTASVELLYVAFASRLLKRPINISVYGPSAGGKSYAVDLAQTFHPPEAIHDLTAMSERALVYSMFDTAHAYVRMSEASALHRDGIGATIVRDLSWGKGLRYETVEKGEDGRLVARIIEKEGPTGLITTTTKPLDPEVSTRVLQVQINDTPEQTRAVMRSLGARAAAGHTDEPDVIPWHAAHRWLFLAGERKVTIPFALILAERVPADDVRMRRDFEQVLAVIEAHALIHQLNRQHDPKGRIVAEEADYRATYRLLSPVMAATLDNVSDTVRETVGTVAQVNRDRQGDGVSYVELGQALGITREAARQRCKQPLRAGFLVNEEFRQGYAAKLILGEPLPEPRAALPPHEVLFAGNVPNSPCELDASLQPVVANAEATVKQPAKVPDPSTLTLNQVDGAVDGAMCSPDGDLGLAVKASSPNSDGGGHV